MGEQAVSLARAVGYDSAGTVEFVMGPDRRFYFLEMNTRLQVEHPVTELVTGIDLVEQMICGAAGEPLAFGQDDVRMDGWAIESRLYAEDPYRNFLPSIGRLNRYRHALTGGADGVTTRIDSGVVEGSEVSIYFDPLVAKLIAHAPDRVGAIDAMAGMLDRTVVDGIAHNQPFLSALMDHPRFREGRLSTAFIAEEYPDGFAGATLDDDLRNRLAMVALAVALHSRERLTSLPGRLNGEGTDWREDWMVKVGGETVALKALAGVVQAPIEIDVVPPGASVPWTLASDWRAGDPIWSGTIDGTPLVVQVRPVPGGVRLAHRGVDVVAKVMTPRVAALEALMLHKKAADTSKVLRCPMPGRVVAIDVVVGQEVRAGEPLAVVEAMKMENVLRAERDLVVAKIDVKPGDSLAVDAVIMEFE
jgi:propionyl-CoA carboxylase alpha subunit